MLEHPDDLLYSQRHTWIRVDKKQNQAEIGLTEDRLDVTPPIESLDMPMIGDELEIDTECLYLHLEGARIQMMRTPLSGRVIAINKDVVDNPELMHINPYENWLYRMELDSPDELEVMMNAKQYCHYLDKF